MRRYLLPSILLLELAGGARLAAQGLDVGFISRSSPTPAFLSPEPAKYNLKFGKLEARIRTSMQIEADDNINLAATTNRAADLMFAPHGEVGFVYPINEIQLLELNVSLGYTWYLYHPSISQIDIDPKTRIDYRIRLIHPIEARVYDAFSIVNDPTTRPDVSANPGSKLINFHLLNNTIGVLCNWEPNTEWRFAGGYSYTLTRSLSSDFIMLDQDTHTYTIGGYREISPRLTVGIDASYAINYYDTNLEFRAESITVGPMAVIRPTQFISINAAIGYTTMHFDNTSIANGVNSQPGGTISAQLTVQHKMNRFFTEDLNLSSGRQLGINNNFNDVTSVQYGLSGRFNSGMTMRTSLTANFLQASAFNENTSEYLYYIGTGRQITRLWNAQIGYTYVFKNSNLPDRGYYQNRLTLDVTREL